MNAANALYILIPVLNGWQQTAECLQALRKSTCREFTVVVIDHGSTDETESGLAQAFPEVIHLRADSDLWWAGATNAGVEHALEQGAEQIVLLNNDCYVEPDCIGLLVDAASQLKGAVVAPVQRRLDTGAILSLAPKPLLWLGFSGRAGPREITESMRRSRFLPVAQIGGGRGVLIPAEVFRKVGLFDSARLPHYHADQDFYLRCRGAGVPLYTVLDASVNVDCSTTSLAERPELMTMQQFKTSLVSRRSHRNLPDLKAFYKKNYPVKKLYWIGLGLNFARYLLVYAVRRSGYLSLVLARAIKGFR
ncbi:MAG: glycosyltransferase family 2 protein [Thiogranum sp.]|nr:glycosyltransferase family 2 protein [Thiogranum sp.]